MEAVRYERIDFKVCEDVEFLKIIRPDGDEDMVYPCKYQPIKVSYDEEGNIKGLSPNWKKTKELYDRCPECKEKRQIVYNMNEHSDGIRYSFNWGLRNVMLKNKSYYVLKMTRANKRDLYRSILSGKEYELIRR